MSYLNNTTEYDIHEKHDFYADLGQVDHCYRCGVTTANGMYISDVWPDDEDQSVRLCDECAEAAMTVSVAADLAAAAETVCTACASTRKTVQEDRLYVNSSAVCCEGKVA